MPSYNDDESKSNYSKYLYNLEIYKNFVITSFLNYDNDELHIFIISETDKRDDLDLLLTFINDKNKILIGYDNHHLDDIILKYLIHSRKPDINNIYSLYRRIKIDEHSSGVRKVKSIRQTWGYSIDLYRLLKIESVKRFKSVQEAGINLLWRRINSHSQYHGKRLTDEEISVIVGNQKEELHLYKKLYKFNRIDETIQSIRILEKDFKMKLLHLDSGEIGNKIISSLYCKYTGIRYEDLVDMRTWRSFVNLKDIIPKSLTFSTIRYIDLLDKLKGVTIHVHDKGIMKGKCDDTGLYQTFLTERGHSVQISLGGLHSNNTPAIYVSNNDKIIADVDVKSYYPSIIINYKLKPSHLDSVFLSIFKKITERRLFEKKNGNKIISKILKIIIVSVFGKFGCPVSWYYDVEKMLAVSVIGQIGMLMLIEKLELNGVDILSVNTDGLTCIMNKNKYEKIKKVFNEWERVFQCNLEWKIYHKYILKDVINYLALTEDGKIVPKGIFNNKQYAKITRKAIINYFLYDKPVNETITTGDNILDYLYYFKAKSGFYFVQNSKIIQGENRWYFSKLGSRLYKVRKKDGSRISIENGEFAKILNIIENYDIPSDINYQAYINHSNHLISQIEKELTQEQIA